MHIDQICSNVVEYCAKNRLYAPSTDEKAMIKEQLKTVIIEQKLSFIISPLNITYDGGDTTMYPKLYGDAVLHYAYTYLEKCMENKQFA